MWKQELENPWHLVDRDNHRNTVSTVEMPQFLDLISAINTRPVCSIAEVVAMSLLATKRSWMHW